MDTEPVLSAESLIDVSFDQARAWFLSLSNHPERYAFESHKGFTFTEGRFGEPGARFETEEIFLGLKVTLKFELTDVSDDQFSFSVLSPTRGAWGYFRLESQGNDTTRLILAVGSDQAPTRLVLRAPVVHGAIQHQIGSEVDHIKRSMESLYQEETWAS